MAVESIDGQWHLENAIEQGDQVVIEWTMTWRHPESGEGRLDRGTEWFLIRDGKIAEVRAYHHGGPKNPQGDLLGFDHEGRGHTMLEDWKAPARLRSAEADRGRPRLLASRHRCTCWITTDPSPTAEATLLTEP